ncbi:unnamed protein product [Calypogeia fissa]
MQTISSSMAAVGSMAAVSGVAALPSRPVYEKSFMSGTALLPTTTLMQKKLSLRGSTKLKLVSASQNESRPNVDSARVATSAAGVLGTSFTMFLSNVGAVQALTKEDVNDAYVKVEEFSTQVTVTAGNIFETAKSLYEKVFTTVKPGLDVAAPYVQQTTETVTKFAAPLASDLAEEAQKALRSAGVDTESGVEFAKSAVEQTSKVLEGAQPIGSSVLESALAADPLFLLEAAGGLVLFYFLAPPLVSIIANNARGYAGDLGAAESLDLLLKQSYTLIDIRTEKEKERYGVPSLPSNSKNKYVPIPLEGFPGKLKSQLRNSRKVEGEVVAIKIAALKRLNKGSKIILIDESGDIAKTVARALKSQGFKNSYVITDGFKGGKGWIQSRLGTDDYSSTGLSFSEVLSPSRIIPAGTTKRLGTKSGPSTGRFNLLPGGVIDE